MKNRSILERIDTPWHSFRGGDSGAWMLHPPDAHALDPVISVDHFRMSQPTFAPHPHAGFSAVTYLFEDSEDGADEIAVVEPTPGVRVRVVLGDFGGVSARIGAHTPLTLLDITLAPQTALDVPLPHGERAFALVVSGDTHALRFGDEGDGVALSGGERGLRLALFAGRPLAEPIFPKGPFIGSSAAEVTDMIRRFQSGAMGALAPTPGAFA